MPDFSQRGPITTLHDLGTTDSARLEDLLRESVRDYPIGLVLPITASDMRAKPFGEIVERLGRADYVDTACVVLNRADSIDDYQEALKRLEPLGPKAKLLWTDGPRGKQALADLDDAGFAVNVPGKGRAVWFAFGFLLADPRLKAYVLQDGDIENYDNDMLVRLALPMAHPGMDFHFCKAYYARCTTKMHGRVVRLLVVPLLRALISVMGNDPYLVFLRSFRYPLAGEFAVTSHLARSNRIPCDWGPGGRHAGGGVPEHRAEARRAGRHRPAVRPQAPAAVVSATRVEGPDEDGPRHPGERHPHALPAAAWCSARGTSSRFRSAYLRLAQDAIRQYHADSLMNGLDYDRHSEEQAIEASRS